MIVSDLCQLVDIGFTHHKILTWASYTKVYIFYLLLAFFVFGGGLRLLTWSLCLALGRWGSFIINFNVSTATSKVCFKYLLYFITNGAW